MQRVPLPSADPLRRIRGHLLEARHEIEKARLASEDLGLAVHDPLRLALDRTALEVEKVEYGARERVTDRRGQRRLAIVEAETSR